MIRNKEFFKHLSLKFYQKNSQDSIPDTKTTITQKTEPNPISTNFENRSIKKSQKKKGKKVVSAKSEKCSSNKTPFSNTKTGSIKGRNTTGNSKKLIHGSKAVTADNIKTVILSSIRGTTDSKKKSGTNRNVSGNNEVTPVHNFADYFNKVQDLPGKMNKSNVNGHSKKLLGVSGGKDHLGVPKFEKFGQECFLKTSSSKKGFPGKDKSQKSIKRVASKREGDFQTIDMYYNVNNVSETPQNSHNLFTKLEGKYQKPTFHANLNVNVNNFEPSYVHHHHVNNTNSHHSHHSGNTYNNYQSNNPPHPQTSPDRKNRTPKTPNPNQNNIIKFFIPKSYSYCRTPPGALTGINSGISNTSSNKNSQPAIGGNQSLKKKTSNGVSGPKLKDHQNSSGRSSGTGLKDAVVNAGNWGFSNYFSKKKKKDYLALSKSIGKRGDKSLSRASERGGKTLGLDFGKKGTNIYRASYTTQGGPEEVLGGECKKGVVKRNCGSGRSSSKKVMLSTGNSFRRNISPRVPDEGTNLYSVKKVKVTKKVAKSKAGS